MSPVSMDRRQEQITCRIVCYGRMSMVGAVMVRAGISRQNVRRNSSPTPLHPSSFSFSCRGEKGAWSACFRGSSRFQSKRSVYCFGIVDELAKQNFGFSLKAFPSPSLLNVSVKYVSPKYLNLHSKYLSISNCDKRVLCYVLHSPAVVEKSSREKRPTRRCRKVAGRKTSKKSQISFNQSW